MKKMSLLSLVLDQRHKTNEIFPVENDVFTKRNEALLRGNKVIPVEYKAHPRVNKAF